MTRVCVTVVFIVIGCGSVIALPTPPTVSPQTATPPTASPEAREPAPPSNCQYWCRTPEDTFYCCKDDQLSDPKEHPGYCPATRAVCPLITKLLPDILPRRDYNGVTFPDLPNLCATDGGCEDYEKCCFDRCFRKHACKFAFSEDTQLRYSDEGALQADVVQLSYAYDPHRFL